MNQNYKFGDTLLYVDGVSVSYDGVPVLKNITMVEKDVIREGISATGQIVAVLGRSGRGKSTLFKCLTGLVKPTDGQVLISDCEGHNKAKIVTEGSVGFVDQKYTLFRHKTVKQALLYALRKTKLTKEEKTKKIDETLQTWNLSEHINKYPCELSGGQRQRVAIIEQLFSSGHFMVMDEPFSGLDVYAIDGVRKAFKRIHAEDEFNTIIFSTHDINLAVELADSIYVIGHVNQEDNFSGIVSHYDLKEMGLAWEDFGVEHIKLVEKIKEDMMNS